MNDLEAILFDLDGVIVDCEPLHEKAFRQTSLYLGHDLTQEEVASLRGTVDKIGAAKLNALVIEDSVNGVRSGKAAGCRVIAITTSFSREHLMEMQADYVVDSFAELERLLGF